MSDQSRVSHADIGRPVRCPWPYSDPWDGSKLTELDAKVQSFKALRMFENAMRYPKLSKPRKTKS
jgi:hypothetical protein